MTNTELPPEEDISQYRGLWVEGRGFRLSKSTLETKLVFHFFSEQRIEAHVCLCFVAYKVYNELERIISSLHLDMSVDTVIRIAKIILSIRLRLPINDKIIEKTMMLTPKQLSIKPLFNYLGV